ncbi:MAG: ABC transporter permease [Fuerstiella sp.]|jgi:ABC-2 type transport system permease protein|nr:ABC transporter permease [Fuerstiella sp.]MCP4508776.1 ABC transporter permease [Fuerstiella sp.]MDG2127795.1 Gldg family protein [Fuerstiella sp.]
MIRANVTLAVSKRNFRSYFSSILGYLFIIVFCVAASVMAFNTQFFAANLANLDQLSQQFPLLLLFLIPAITMTVWSDERKLGTDELLFTLPATDVEILVGKYLSVLGVYTVAIIFSLVNAVFLSRMGDPDFGLLTSSYCGYWLSGAALLSVGMLASALTSSATVAFVLGVVFCCVPVFIGNLAGLTEWLLTQFGFGGQSYGFRIAVQGLSLQEQLRDFSLGVLPLTSFCYFVFLTGLMLYLNLVVISKRRWHATEVVGMELQYASRAICLGVTLISTLVLVSMWPARADLTAESLFTLSGATYETIDGIEEGQLITIQAFVSPDVPREYSETRRRLLGLLREFDLRGGSHLEVRIVDVEPFSEAAEEARALGVNPRRIQYQQDGKFEEAEVFLGAIVQSPTDNVEIPFFGKGLPIEYELTRSVRTVSQKDRLTIGVLQTDANVIAGGGGMGGGGRDWAIVSELRKQYKVIGVNPSRKILAGENSEDDTDDAVEDFDVLLAVMPSSLTQPQMDNFMEFVQAGKPVLVFDDPCPIFAQGQFGLTMAPKLPKPSPGGGMMMMQQQQRPEPKADNGELRSLMSLLDVRWDNGQAVYDRMNPHSQFGSLPPEYVFVSRAGNPKQAFSSESVITKDLDDLVCLYAGSIQETSKKKEQEFIPLLQTSGESGLLPWEGYISQSFNPMTMSPAARINPEPARFDDTYSHVIAAHIRNESDDNPVNVIFCSDVDMISDWFFMERNLGNLDIAFDNVTFILNAVDALAQEETFIDLRSRRASLKTLEYVESQTRELRTKMNDEEKAADKIMTDRLDSARKELQAEITEVRERTDLDERSMSQLLKQKEEQLNRKLELDEQELEREKNASIRKAGLEMKREIRRVETRVRLFAYILPAILPICFGLLFLGLRRSAEQQSITAERRRR